MLKWGKKKSIDSHRLIIPRQLLHLLVALRGELKDEAELRSILSSKRFVRQLSNVVERAGFGKSSSCEAALSLLGNAVKTLSIQDVPCFLRDIYSGKSITTPMNVIDDYLYTSQLYPRWTIDIEKIQKTTAEFVDVLVVDKHLPQIENQVFRSRLGNAYSSSLTEAEGKSTREGLDILQESLELLLNSLITTFALNWSQRYQLGFAWYMSYIGLPISESYEDRGGIGSQRTYLGEIQALCDIAFNDSDDGELSDELCEEHVDKFKELNFSQHRAGRYWYFLSCLSEMDLLELPSPSVIFGECHNIENPSDAYLISNRCYGQALTLAMEYGEEEGRMIQFALVALRCFSLRRSEAWNSRFDQFQKSAHHMFWEVGGRGREKPKGTASNRSPGFYYDSYPEEQKAIDHITELREKHDVDRLDYIFHTGERTYRNRDKVRFFRKVAAVLKRATGNPRVRPHHLRKTGLNDLKLGIAAGEARTHRSKYLCSEAVLRPMNIPSGLRSGGCRGKFVAEAIKRHAGHKGITTFVRGYQVFAAEEYSDALSGNSVEQLVDENIRVLSNGLVSSAENLQKIKDDKRPSGFPLPLTPEQTKRAPTTMGKVCTRSQESIALTPINIGHILLGRKPPEISTLSKFSDSSRESFLKVYGVAESIAEDMDFSLWSGYGDSFDKEPLQRVLDVKRVGPVIERLEELSHLRIDSGFYKAEGIWRNAYRRGLEDIDHFVLDERVALEHLLHNFSDIGIARPSIKAKCLEGGRSHSLLEAAKDIKYEIVSKRQLLSFRPQKLADPAVVYLVRNPGSCFEYMKSLNFYQFVLAVWVDLQKD